MAISLARTTFGQAATPVRFPVHYSADESGYDFSSFVPAAAALRVCIETMSFGGSITEDQSVDLLEAFGEALCTAELAQDGSRLEQALLWATCGDMITALVAEARNACEMGDYDMHDLCFDFVRQLAPHGLMGVYGATRSQSCLPFFTPA